MAQRQNTFAAILAALTLAPQLVHSAQQSGASNEEKHASVANAIAAVATVGGAIVEAQNPLYAPFIDAAIKAAVAIAQQSNFATPPPIVMVPMAALPDDHPLLGAAMNTPTPPTTTT